MLDLKQDFLCIPWSAKSQELLLLNGEVQTGRRPQLGWYYHSTTTGLVFKNSPTMFGNQLANELGEWKNQNPLEFCYILIATETKQQCWDQSVALLNFLGLSGSRVSKDKLQIVQTILTFLGFKILQGQRRLGQE